MDRFNLGSHTRTISTHSADAQHYFNLGLNWCYGFNQEEGAKCFQRAVEFDSHCAMAFWGIAYASGPFYNLPWRDMGEEEANKVTAICYQHSQTAKTLSKHCTAPEQALINALTNRFQKPSSVACEQFDGWDDAYANAMRVAYQAHPEDFDVMALFAEALITRTPWQLWNVKTGEAATGADTLEALALCKRAVQLADELNISQHPAILHLHIHVTEMSNAPEQALCSANTLATLCPDAGHLNHMPGHTYVLCGMYEKAKIASEKAISADQMYADYAGSLNFYTTARCHDLHLMMYTCMFLGQFKPAIVAAEQICSILTKDVLEVSNRPQLAATMEGYYAMKMHVLIRFGRWQTIVDTPMLEHPDLYCVTTAMHHYAKVVAYAALKQISSAEQHRLLFYASLKRIPDSRKFFNNGALTILAIADEMLNGELEYHKGNYIKAYEHLRESVQRDDDLDYSEPWAWMHPPRHALAALLIEQGHFGEAEQVYRTDLGLNKELQRCAQHPRNIWALHGLVECLQQRCEKQELPKLRKMLVIAMQKTDVPITSSCLCRGSVCSSINAG